MDYKDKTYYFLIFTKNIKETQPLIQKIYISKCQNCLRRFLVICRFCKWIVSLRSVPESIPNFKLTRFKRSMNEYNLNVNHALL